MIMAMFGSVLMTTQRHELGPELTSATSTSIVGFERIDGEYTGI
jgi:hypothetical protein